MNIERRRLLPTLLKHFGLPLIAVEVGVCGGAFSQELLEEGIEKIFCVDNWSKIEGVTGDGNYENDFHEMTYKEYQKRFAEGYEGRVVTLKGLSSAMHSYIPDNSLGLFYQDGGHQYQTVVEDLYNYVPKLVSGGIVGAHDYFNGGYGVKQAVDEYVAKHNLTLNHIPEDNPNCASVWFRKK